MSDDKLPEWPREFGRGETVNEWKAANYERARAEAALARLRVAVAELQRIANNEKLASVPGSTKRRAQEALTAIGDIPHD